MLKNNNIPKNTPDFTFFCYSDRQLEFYLLEKVEGVSLDYGTVEGKGTAPAPG